MEERDEFMITRFINPHLFWLRNLSMAYDRRFIKFELSMNQAYKQNSQKNRPYKANVKEFVAFFYSKDKKWLRGIVESIRQPDPSSPVHELIVWAVDYGFPVQVKDEHIRKLTKEFQTQTFSHVIKGGISCVMPAEEEIDFINQKRIFVMTKEWPQLIVDKLGSLLEDAQSIVFERELARGDHQFGDLTVILVSGEERSVRQMLLYSNYVKAVDGPVFLQTLNKYNTVNFESWHNNRGHSIFQSYHSDTRRVVEEASVRDIEVPPLTELKQSYEKVGDWLEQNCNTVADLNETIAEDEDDDSDEMPSLTRAPNAKISPLKTISNTSEVDDDEEDKESEARGPVVITNVSYQPKPKNDSDVNDPYSDMPGLNTNTHEKNEYWYSQATESRMQPAKLKQMTSMEQCNDLLKNLRLKRAEKVEAHKNQVQARRPKENHDKDQEDCTKIMGLIPHDMAAIKAVADAAKNAKCPRPPKAKPLPVPAPEPYKKPSPHKDTASTKSGSSRLDAILANMNVGKVIQQHTAHAKKDQNATSSDDDNNPINENYRNLINNEEQLTFNWKVDARLHDDDGRSKCMENPLVLAHGKRVTAAVKSFKDVAFSHSVDNFMSQYMRDARRIQLYAWPHLIQENSAIIIGAAQTGKTLAYVPALCSSVEQLITDEEVVDGKGPIALILAQTANEVQSIAKKCKQCLELFDRNKNSKLTLICQAYARFKHEDLEGSLLNGVGILVVTPPCLERLVNNRINLFNKKRLKIITVDNYDVGIKRHGNLIHEMIEYFHCRRTADGNPTQLIITSNQWENDLIKYCGYGKNMELLIGHYAETALYGGAKLRISMMQKSQKMEFLYEKYLKDKSYAECRTIIVCAVEDDIEELSDFLAERHINVTLYGENSSEGDKTAAFTWHEKASGEYTVLLTTDSMLGNLVDCKNVQLLLNYSLPDTWGRLSFRFSVFFDYYHNFVVKPKPDSYEAPISHILIDETENLECFPRFMNFMKRTKAQISPQHLEFAEKIIAEREESRQSIALCQQFLQFGECSRINCRDRHTLQPTDRPSSRMPKAGHILKLHLTHVHSPSHYSARILATRREKETMWHDFNQHAYVELGMKIAQYFGNSDNVRDHGEPKKGDICAFLAGNTYQRCQILDVPRTKTIKRDLNVLNVKVIIRLIDHGMIRHSVKSTSLYYLPQELSIEAYPPQVFDIHLSGILPYDGDTDWDQNTWAVVNKILSKYYDVSRKDNATNYIKCQAEFVLENHIWTQKLATVEKLVGLNQVREMHAVHKILLNDKVAEKDPEQKGLSRIRELANIMGFLSKKIDITYVPPEGEVMPDDDDSESEPEPEFNPPKARGQFEFIEQSRLTQIRYSCIEPNGTFFFQRADKMEGLPTLYDTIDKFVANAENIQPVKIFEPGENCLLKVEDDYTRVRIIKVSSELEEKSCEVYSLDTGFIDDQVPEADLFETSDEITEKVKFQAILGKFAGVLPLSDDGFTQEQVKMMDEIIEENKDHLFVRFVHSNQNVDWFQKWGLNFYDLLLLTIPDMENVKLLNQVFIDKGLARADPAKNLSDISLEELIKELKPNKDDSDEEDWDKYVGTYKAQIDPTLSLNSNTNGDSNVSKLFENMDFDNLEEDDVENFLEFFGMKHLLKPESKSESKDLPALPAPETKETENKPEEMKPLPKPDLLAHEPVNNIKIIPLTCPYRAPEVVWQQNDTLVMCSVKMGDIETYYLEITEEDLILEFPSHHEDEEPLVLAFNFYAHVDTSLASYEKRGLNLIIRLPKLFKGIPWPRLHKPNEKFSYIKYNYDTLKTLDDDCIDFHVNAKGESEESENEYDSDDCDGFVDDEEMDAYDPLYDGFE